MSYLPYALAAMFAYAVGNIIIDHNLKGVSPLVNVAAYSGGMLVLSLLAILWQVRGGEKMVLPNSAQASWLIALTLTLFVADFCYYSAYGAGGNFSQITVIASFVPLFAIFINSACTLTAPTTNQLIAAVMAVGAVYVATK